MLLSSRYRAVERVKIATTFALFFCLSILASPTVVSGQVVRNTDYNDSLVVFVHGFTGDANDTWGSFPDLITADDRLNHFDVMNFGYPSSVFGSSPDITKLGKYFGSSLTTIDSKYKNLVLVGHSMGGLVIRSHIIGKLIDNKAAELTSIRRIILFGTPNEGMPNASLIPSFINNQINDMNQTSELIVAIRKQWINRVYNPTTDDSSHKKINTIVIVGLEDRFVPESSAASFFSDVEVTTGNHVSMVKPSDSSHLSFKLLRKYLLDTQLVNSVYDVEKLKEALIIVQSSLEEKLQFISGELDKYINNPNEQNWKELKNKASNNIENVKSAINAAIKFDSSNIINLINNSSKKDADRLRKFKKISAILNDRRILLGIISEDNIPDEGKVYMWRDTLHEIYRDLQKEVYELLKEVA